MENKLTKHDIKKLCHIQRTPTGLFLDEIVADTETTDLEIILDRIDDYPNWHSSIKNTLRQRINSIRKVEESLVYE